MAIRSLAYYSLGTLCVVYRKHSFNGYDNCDAHVQVKARQKTLGPNAIGFLFVFALNNVRCNVVSSSSRLHRRPSTRPILWIHIGALRTICFLWFPAAQAGDGHGTYAFRLHDLQPEQSICYANTFEFSLTRSATVAAVGI